MTNKSLYILVQLSLDFKQQSPRLWVVPGPLAVVDTQSVVQRRFDIPPCPSLLTDFADVLLECLNIVPERVLPPRRRSSAIKVARGLSNDGNITFCLQKSYRMLKHFNLFLPREQMQYHAKLHHVKLALQLLQHSTRIIQDCLHSKLRLERVSIPKQLVAQINKPSLQLDAGKIVARHAVIHELPDVLAKTATDVEELLVPVAQPGQQPRVDVGSVGQVQFQEAELA